MCQERPAKPLLFAGENGSSHNAIRNSMRYLGYCFDHCNMKGTLISILMEGIKLADSVSLHLLGNYGTCLNVSKFVGAAYRRLASSKLSHLILAIAPKTEIKPSGPISGKRQQKANINLPPSDVIKNSYFIKIINRS